MKVNIDNCKVSVLKGIASVLGVSMVEAYDICSANQAPFKTSDGMDTFVKEKSISRKFEGIDGQEEMAEFIDNLSKNPPESIAGIKVVSIKDYIN